MDTESIKQRLDGYKETLSDIYIGRIIVLIIIVVLTVYASYSILLTPNVTKPTDEHEFQITYSTDKIIVEQTQGEILDSNIEADIQYSDGFVQESSISLTDSNPKDQVEFAFDVSDVNKSVLYWKSDDERIDILTEPVPEKYKVEPPKLTVTDKSKKVGETLTITENDYILDTESKISSYDWKVGSELTFSGSTLQHTFSEPGTYSSELTVTDDYGNQETETFEITVDETNIIDSVNIPSNISVGEQITLSYDTNSSYTVDDLSSQVWNISGSMYTTREVEHTFDSGGSKDMSLKVKTEDGLEDKYEDIIQTGDTGVEINVQQSTGKQIIFNLSEGTDADYFDYQWEFGDLESDITTEPEVVHEYDSNGTYEVKVTATDSSGATAEDTVSISVPYESQESDEQDQSFDTEIEDADVRITVEATGNQYWNVESIEGENPDNILQDQPMTAQNPTLYLQNETRYEITGIPNGDDVLRDLDFQIRDLLGETLLSQASEGTLEDEDSIDWYDSEGTVRFTTSELLEDEISGYESAKHDTTMDGSIEIMNEY